MQDDKEEAVRQLQGVLAAHRKAHGGQSSPASESSGYMSNVSPQQMRVGSASPPSSNCDDVLDLSTDRRNSTSEVASSRSSPGIYSGSNSNLHGLHGHVNHTRGGKLRKNTLKSQQVGNVLLISFNFTKL